MHATRLQPPTERPDVTSSWHLYVLRLRRDTLRIDRNAFIEALKVRKIGSSVHYRPLHMMRFYAEKYGHRPDHFPGARRLRTHAVAAAFTASER